jgi:hypothetical protein
MFRHDRSVVAMMLGFFTVVFWVTLYGPLSRGQTVTPPQVIPPGSEVRWDAPTTNADGTPLADLARYDVALTEVGILPGAATLKVIPVPEPATKLDVETLLGGQPAGAYHVWVRAVDLSENASTWTGPLEVYWDRVAPMPPINLKIVVNVNVSVSTGGTP